VLLLKPFLSSLDRLEERFGGKETTEPAADNDDVVTGIGLT
jgi:hypothetical protein